MPEDLSAQIGSISRRLLAEATAAAATVGRLDAGEIATGLPAESLVGAVDPSGGMSFPGITRFPEVVSALPPGVPSSVSHLSSALPRPDQADRLSVVTRESAPRSQPQSSDLSGLRAFVAQVRQADFRQAGLFCPSSSPSATPPTTIPNPTPTSVPGNAGLLATRASGVAVRPFDVQLVRRDFPILNQLVHGQPLAWLDNAATTQKPAVVIDALSAFYRGDNSNIHRAAHTLAARATDAYEHARQTVQQFLGAGSPDEIVFVRGTTEGLNLIANTFARQQLQPGDEILLSTLEHHANIVPWQMLARERGLVIKVVPINDQGEILLSEYQALLSPRTRIVGLTHASNSLGTVVPIPEMSQMAKRVGATVVVDGAQTVAHRSIQVTELGCDFFVFSGHKLFGPTGIGAVYGRQELWEQSPPWQGGGNMIRSVTFDETTYADPPARFEAGTPNIADAVGMGVAIDYLRQFDPAAIAAYEHRLLERATEGLQRIPGLRIVGTAREKIGVVSFTLANRSVEEIGKQLDREGIAVRAGHHCAQPSLRRMGVEATVRPSFALYNTEEEVERLITAVRRLAGR